MDYQKVIDETIQLHREHIYKLYPKSYSVSDKNKRRLYAEQNLSSIAKEIETSLLEKYRYVLKGSDVEIRDAIDDSLDVFLDEYSL